MWTKYDYLCTDCDALMAITTLQDIREWRGWCSCGSAQLINIGIHDAETNNTKKIDHTKQAPIGMLLNKYRPVTKNTPTQVVKINSNPYN